MIYLVCFGLSVWMAHLANKAETKKKIWLFSLLSIGVMVVLSGLRGYSVGTDVMNYFTKDLYWTGATGASSLLDYFRLYFPQGYGDPLFATLVGVIAQYTGSFPLFLFVVHTIILSCMYVGIFRHRKIIDPAFVLLIFYLFFYNHSLNVMRQYIAMSILFAFFADITQGKWWRYLLGVGLAALFHSTAVLGVVPLVLYYVLQFKKDTLRVTPFQRQMVVAGVISLGITLFSPLLRLAMNLGLLNSRFLFFLEDESKTPALIMAAMVVMGLVAAAIFIKPMRQKSEHADFYVFNSLIYLVMLQLTVSVAYGKRIGMYFAMADLITLGLIESAPKDEKWQKIIRYGMVLVALVYWTYAYVLRNASDTFPYVTWFL